MAPVREEAEEGGGRFRDVHGSIPFGLRGPERNRWHGWGRRSATLANRPGRQRA
jgi:hypothetical protein